MTQSRSLVEIQKEVTVELANKEAVKMLLATTFKGLSQEVMPQAITEGMIRGFTFKDFLEKNIYAIPYGSGYSLVTSIDHSRKIGMRSGIIGTMAPEFEVTTVEGKEKIVSCTVMVKRRIGEDIGEFTARVYFDEYYRAGKTYNNEYKPSLWDTKPRTMISKVAEMHALRKACPEELSQSYVEEELERDRKPAVATVMYDKQKCIEKLDAAQNLEELKTAWASLPPEAKAELENYKEDLKKKHESREVR